MVHVRCDSLHSGLHGMTYRSIGLDGVTVSPDTEERIRILVNRLRNALKLVKK